MEKPVENCAPTQKSRFPKAAALAGTALALPIAANAGLITGGPFPTVTSTSVSGNQTLDLDLNGGGTDFTFTASFTNKTVTVLPVSAGAAYVGVTGPLPMQQPFTVDGSSPFLTGTGTIQQSIKFVKYKMDGPWPTNGGFAYLGIRFMDGGLPVYGWIQLSATTLDEDCCILLDRTTSNFTVNAFAYQNDGSGITVDAPEPASLAMFALGAAGILAMRARRKRAA